MECRMSIEKTEAAIEAILFTMGESVEAEKDRSGYRTRCRYNSQDYP